MSGKWLRMVVIAMSFLALTAFAQSVGRLEEHSDDHREETVIVDVWEAAPPTEAKSTPAPGRFSHEFARAGLQAAITMESLQNRLAFVIEHGYPLGEYWVMRERERVEEALKFAGLTASTDADRAALEQLVIQEKNLSQWSAGLVEGFRTMRLGEYYTSASALKEDDLFQRIVACSESLLPVLATGQFAEDISCH